MAVGIEIIARLATAHDTVNRVKVVNHQDVTGTFVASGFELSQVLLPQPSLSAAGNGRRNAATGRDLIVAAVLVAEPLRKDPSPIPNLGLRSVKVLACRHPIGVR